MTGQTIINIDPVYKITYDSGQTYVVKRGTALGIGIAFLTGGENWLYDSASHCGICVGNNEGIEATGTQGVHLVKLDQEYFKNTNCAISFLEPLRKHLVDEQRIRYEAEKYLGRGYDYKLFAAWTFISTYPGLWLPEGGKDWILEKGDALDRFICSEYAFQVNYDLGFAQNITGYMPARKWNPALLAKPAYFYKKWKTHIEDLKI